MTNPLRITLLLTGLFALQGGAARAASVAAPSAWSWWASTEAAYGYKDNLVLSHTDEERSALARGSVQFLLMRATDAPLDLSLYTQAARTHFFSGRTIDHAAEVWSQAEAGYRLGEQWKFTVDARGYYDDGVFDVSESSVEQRVAELSVAGVTVGPTVRWTFHPAWWIEAEAVLQRERVQDGDDDRKVGEGWLRVGWRRGDRLQISLAAMERWHNYDFLPLYSAVGRELADTHRKIAERQGELRIDVTWGAAAHWKTSTRAQVGDYTDNGSGYFNTREKRVNQQVTWTYEPWLARLEGGAQRVDYKVQTVGFGSPPPRVKDEFTGKFLLERKLGSRWAIFSNYAWRRVRSNDIVASYVVNEGLLGLRWSWDK